MDLITVKKTAADFSRKNKAVEHRIYLNEKEGEFYVTWVNEKGFTMLLEDETGTALEIGSARLNRFKLETAFLNGNEITVSNDLPIKGNAKATEAEPAIKKSTPGQKTKIPMETKTKAAKTAKKVSKKSSGPTKDIPAGAKKQTITIKKMRELNKSGHTFYTVKGVKFSQWSIDGFKSADREVEIFILAPSKGK